MYMSYGVLPPPQSACTCDGASFGTGVVFPDTPTIKNSAKDRKQAAEIGQSMRG